MKKQSGFTLIELVMVIVILGVLAVTVLPQFVDMKIDAQAAAAQGVAGSLSSAAAMNHAARTANSSKGAAVTTCGSVVALLQGGVLPSSAYSLATTDSAVTVGVGVSVSCTLTYTSGSTTATTTFTAIGIS